MSHYAKHLVLDATPAAVYAALTTPAGLRGWWSEDSDIADAVGGTHTFRFGPHRKELSIERLVPGQEVRWRCTGAHIAVARLPRPDEWVGTEIVFRLAPAGIARTDLDFDHIGLEPTLGCYDMCEAGWDHFLESLRRLLETGRGTPHVPEGASLCAA